MNKIPKVIHYCWFGGAKIPPELQKYIDGWHKMMPDYKIIRWDESNYDVTKNTYMKEAYDAKKWAFVSDYARLDIIYNHGGIYLDTDVEALKPFDNLLTLTGFCGREQGKKIDEVNTGLIIAAQKNLHIIKEMLDDYNNIHFKLKNGKYDTMPCPTRQTAYLKKKGLIEKSNKTQVVDDLTIFSTDYFCPMNQYTGKTTFTNNTYSIHHYKASWNSQADQYRRELRIKYSYLGSFLSTIISTFIAYKKSYGIIKMWPNIIRKVL